MEFDPANFVDPTLDLNPFHPLRPGVQWVRGGTTEVGSRVVPHEIITTMTDVIRIIDGVPTTIAMLDEQTDSREISQLSIDYMALDKWGNIWIPGGYTEDLQGGQSTNLDTAYLGQGSGAEPTAQQHNARHRSSPSECAGQYRGAGILGGRTGEQEEVAVSACQAEQETVDKLLELVAELEPNPDDKPAERLKDLREQAVVRNMLVQAKADLAACRTRNTWSEVRLQVVRMADSDGSNQTSITPENVGEWARVANQVLAPARLRLLFDAASDFGTRTNTRLNQLVVGTGLQADVDADVDANNIADLSPDRIVVICRTSRSLADLPDGGCGPGCGFSGFPSKHVLMPAFDPNLTSLFAHELGHYFGLPHTFKHVVDTTRDAGVVFDLLNQDLDALDGDKSVVGDTSPEMIIDDQNAGGNTSIVLRGKTMSLLRDNVMSYYRPLSPNAKTITAGQASRMQTVMNERGRAGLRVTEVIAEA